MRSMSEPYVDPYGSPAAPPPVTPLSATTPDPHDSAPIHSGRTTVPALASHEVPAISVEGVSRSFGKVAAVRNLSFQTRPGRVTALVGPNGCGKSTLMLMLASLLSPDTGRVRIQGIDPSEASEKVRTVVGWMPDSFGAWESLKVREVLETMARAHFIERQRARTRVLELLQLLDLGSLAEQSAHVLSRGQKQRLGLARALVHSPQLLILDEPASGLDPASRRRLFTIVRNFARDGGSVLISSHILSELEEMADDVVFMDSGSLVEQVDLSSMGERPRQWRIVVLDGPALTATLAQLKTPYTLPETDIVPRPGQKLAVTCELPNEGASARLLTELVSRRVPIVEFAPAAGTLESVYMSLAGAHKEGAL